MAMVSQSISRWLDNISAAAMAMVAAAAASQARSRTMAQGGGSCAPVGSLGGHGARVGPLRRAAKSRRARRTGRQQTRSCRLLHTRQAAHLCARHHDALLSKLLTRSRPEGIGL